MSCVVCNSKENGNEEILALPAVAAIVSAFAGAAQADCGCAVSYENCGSGLVDSTGPATQTVMRKVRKVVYEQETVQGSKMENQIVYEDKVVNRTRYERETHNREVSYTVNVPVRETHTGVRNYTVKRPVYETHTKQVTYNVRRPVYEIIARLLTTRNGSCS